MKSQRMLALLQRPPLNYQPKKGRGKGPHILLTAINRPLIIFAYHVGDTIPPHVVREILTKQAGLDIEEALRIVRGRNK